VRSLRVDYPVAVDSDHAIWRSFGNRYWPALYLVDAGAPREGWATAGAIASAASAARMMIGVLLIEGSPVCRQEV